MKPKIKFTREERLRNRTDHLKRALEANMPDFFLADSCAMYVLCYHKSHLRFIWYRFKKYIKYRWYCVTNYFIIKKEIKLQDDWDFLQEHLKHFDKEN